MMAQTTKLIGTKWNYSLTVCLKKSHLNGLNENRPILTMGGFRVLSCFGAGDDH